MTLKSPTPDAWRKGCLSYGSRLTLAAAQKMIEGGKIEAEKLGVPMAISIVDTGGNLIAFNRMDNVMLLSIQISMDKAFIAVFGKRPSGHWKQEMQKGIMVPGFIHERLTVLGGGYTIIEDGVIIGGIGVSGGTIEDHYVARAVLNAGGFPTIEVDAYITEFEVVKKK